MPTRTLTLSIDGDDGLLKRSTITAEGYQVLSLVIPPTTTDELVAFVLDISQAKLLLMGADGALTVETNSSGSPANTFTLGATASFLWKDGDATMKDTAGASVVDITRLYITNSGDANVQFDLRCLVDPTV